MNRFPSTVSGRRCATCVCGSRLSQRGRVLALAAAMLVAASGASAQWTATVLRERSTSSYSNATCVFGERQGGYFDNGYSYPLVWRTTEASMVQLVEPGPDSGSQVLAISETSMVGVGYVRTSDTEGYYAGLLWNAAGDEVTLLEVPGGIEPEATGVSGNTQVGRVSLDDSTHPVLWHGSTDSWVDLLPAGASYGECEGTDGTQQVGNSYVNGTEMASLWTGNAASWMSLHPAGWDASDAVSVSDDVQAGTVYRNSETEYARHAAIWAGTAASFVDLHPSAASYSEATGTSHGLICGTCDMADDSSHAAFWAGPSADSYVDLHAMLPSGFVASQARGIWTDGAGLVRIVGDATTGEPDYTSVAVMWTLGGGGGCPSDFNLDGGVDGADVEAFFIAWESGDTSADLNTDGGVDGADLGTFFGHWEAGC